MPLRAHHGVSIAAVSRRQLRPKLMRIRPRRSRDRGWGRVAGGWQATDVPGRPPTAVASAGAPLCGRARGGDARRRGRGDAHGGCTERCGQPRKLDPLPQPPSPPPSAGLAVRALTISALRTRTGVRWPCQQGTRCKSAGPELPILRRTTGSACTRAPTRLTPTTWTIFTSKRWGPRCPAPRSCVC